MPARLPSEATHPNWTTIFEGPAVSGRVVKSQVVRLLHSGNELYRELFCGVAGADWHAADDSIISDIKALESLVGIRREIKSMISSGVVYGVNIGFMTAVCAGDLFLTHLSRIMKSGVIEITEHGSENMSSERIAALIGFCAKARQAGYRVVLDDVSPGYPLLGENFLLRVSPYAVKAVIGIKGLASIAAKAARMRMLLIIENIESRQDMVAAAASGANALQGYWIERPKPAVAKLT